MSKTLSDIIAIRILILLKKNMIYFTVIAKMKKTSMCDAPNIAFNTLDQATAYSYEMLKKDYYEYIDIKRVEDGVNIAVQRIK